MASCCQPTLGSWGSGSSAKTTSWLLARSVQLGDSNPASIKECAHLLTASKQRTGPYHGVSHCWVSLAHHFQAICPFGPWAPSLILVGLVSPRPPWKKGNVAVTSADPPPWEFKINRRHSHTCASWVAAQVEVKSGWTPLNP